MIQWSDLSSGPFFDLIKSMDLMNQILKDYKSAGLINQIPTRNLAPTVEKFLI
jgi:hypothetical protein